MTLHSNERRGAQQPVKIGSMVNNMLAIIAKKENAENFHSSKAIRVHISSNLWSK